MVDESDSDWRLHGQDKHMVGARLSWRSYRQPRPDWDHDHCEFCGAKFMEAQGPDTLQAGYCTADGRRWVCLDCCRDFKARFGWTTEGGSTDA